MSKKYNYTLEEIDNLRLIVWLLNLSDQVHDQLSVYERIDLTEKMLNTYMSQGIRYDELSVKYRDKECKKSKKTEVNDN